MALEPNGLLSLLGFQELRRYRVIVSLHIAKHGLINSNLLLHAERKV
jgi:hypothetical protein